MATVEKKILLVDDKPENLIALEKLLQTFDVTLVKSYSGNEALTLTLEHDFALALIDVQMPDMDGYETVKLMRNVERTRLLPVIFLSAIYSENHYLIQGIEAGAVDFITKPIQPRILLGKVKIFLDLYQQRWELEHEIECRKQVERTLLEAEKQLKIAKEKAEEADRLKTAFLSNMSHEIRTPLNAIVGFSNLLVNSSFDNEKKQQFHKYITNSSDALTTLINDILDIARIEAGELSIQQSEVNISALLNVLYITFSEELAKKENKELGLKLKLPPDKVYIRTDEVRIRQVVSNLLNNALKFCKKGIIEFGIQSITASNIVLFVSDTGIGIEKDKLSIIFDRFQQVNDERIENAGGTGLGLSIVKKIVELLGGNIQVSSEMEKGTIFTIHLNGVVCETIDVSPKAVQGDLPAVLNLDNKKILIAEDEITNYYLLQEILSPTKAQIKWVRDGSDAIECYKNKEVFDLIFMDIKMPRVNGYEAFEKIRKIDKNVPIIAQTAYAMSNEKSDIISFGFNGYLPKPIVEKDLLILLSKFIKK